MEKVNHFIVMIGPFCVGWVLVDLIKFIVGLIVRRSRV